MQNKRNTKHIIKSFIFGVVLTTLFLPFVSSAQTIGGNDAVFGGSDIRQSTKVALGNPDEKDPRDIAASIINVVFGFLGLLAVSLTLYAGYIWMTSQGQPDKIEKAKDILKNAAIGILIILSAYAIVLFIFRMFFGGNLLSGGGGGNKSRGAGIGALGNGIIVSLYPAPNQTDVPRNTGIIVTFREPIDPRTICATTTVPVAGVAGCNGELIATTTVTAGPPTTFVPNIRIYFTQNAKNCEVADAAFADPVKQALCGKMFSARVYSTQDNKTFVFKPTEYLGSPSEYIWHTVYMTKNIKKMNGEEAFKSFNSVRDTSWSFEVSNKLDLEPPRVDPAALYPAPDNFSDEVLTESIFVQASSTVIVSNPVSVENLAKVVSIATSSGAFDNKATSTINEECDESEIKVGVAKYDGELVYTASSTKKLGKGELSSDNKSLVFAICNLKLTPSPEYGLFTEGNFWKITINKYVEPARLTIGNHVYTASSSNNLKYRTFAVGLTSDLTADSLKNLINADEDASASSTRSTNILTLVSRTFGVTGNDIQLASNDNLSLAVMANKLTGGKAGQLPQKIEEMIVKAGVNRNALYPFDDPTIVTTFENIVHKASSLGYPEFYDIKKNLGSLLGLRERSNEIQFMRNEIKINPNFSRSLLNVWEKPLRSDELSILYLISRTIAYCIDRLRNVDKWPPETNLRFFASYTNLGFVLLLIYALSFIIF